MNPRFNWDVIQLGVPGDIVMKDGVARISLEDYQANLRNMLDHLINKYPRASLIFNTITPIDGTDDERTQQQLLANQAALNVIEESYPKVAVTDLYKLALPHRKTWLKGKIIISILWA